MDKKKIFNKHDKMIIGMVHLLPLPGAPLHDFDGGMNKITERAFSDFQRLVDGGVDGVQIENQWDRPFQKTGNICIETLASMALVIGLLKKEFNLPMGINVHMNGAMEAMAIASVTGCQWIRVFELANAYISNSGYVDAIGPELLRYRVKLRMENSVGILGDFHVKHGSHQIVFDRDIVDLARDVQTALADGLIITGLETGKAPDFESIQKIKKHIDIPLFIGSGLSINNLEEILPFIDGAIVGSAFKPNGDLMKPVDTVMVRRFMDIVNKHRG